MALSLFTANEGYLDDVEVAKVVDFEAALHTYMNTEHAELMEKINKTPEYTDEVQKAFHEAIKEFKASHAW